MGNADINQVFNFKTQLSVGNTGEKEFLIRYPSFKQADGIKYDFITPEEQTIELKTDTYSMEKTENFFMEFHSNVNSQTLGGPWRAARDKVDFFVYYFIRDK